MTAQSHAAAPAPHTYFGYADPAEHPADTLEDTAQALRAIGDLLVNFDDNCVLDRDTLSGVNLLMLAIARQITAIAPFCASDRVTSDYPRFTVGARGPSQGDIWHTLDEYAAMGLPGLPERADDAHWLTLIRDWNNARRFREGQGDIREYSLNHLPGDAQAEYFRRAQQQKVA